MYEQSKTDGGESASLVLHFTSIETVKDWRFIFLINKTNLGRLVLLEELIFR